MKLGVAKVTKYHKQKQWEIPQQLLIICLDWQTNATINYANVLKGPVWFEESSPLSAFRSPVIHFLLEKKNLNFQLYEFSTWEWCIENKRSCRIDFWFDLDQEGKKMTLKLDQRVFPHWTFNSEILRHGINEFRVAINGFSPTGNFNIDSNPRDN